MAARSSSSSKRRQRFDWRSLLTRRTVIAAVFALGALALCLTSFARERRASMSPMARSRNDIALGLLLAKRPASMDRHWRTIAAHDPLQAAAFVVKGIAMMNGKLDRAPQVEPLMAAALDRQPGLDQPRVWLAAWHVRNGEIERAVHEFDTSLARSNGLIEPAMPILVLLLQDPRSRPGMLERMRAWPRWRTPALIALIVRGGLPQSEVASLLAGPAPSGQQAFLDAERQALLRKLVASGQTSQAYDLFRRYAGIDSASPLYDGKFVVAHPLQPFGWMLAGEAEDYVERIDNREGGWMLRAHASGKRSIVLLQQTLGLTAGDWTFTMAARDGGLAKPDTMTLALECVGETIRPALAERGLGGLGPVAGQTVLRVAVPAECPLQRLVLRGAEGEGANDPAEIEVLSFGLSR